MLLKRRDRAIKDDDSAAFERKKRIKDIKRYTARYARCGESYACESTVEQIDDDSALILADMRKAAYLSGEPL